MNYPWINQDTSTSSLDKTLYISLHTNNIPNFFPWRTKLSLTVINNMQPKKDRIIIPFALYCLYQSNNYQFDKTWVDKFHLHGNNWLTAIHPSSPFSNAITYIRPLSHFQITIISLQFRNMQVNPPLLNHSNGYFY